MLSQLAPLSTIVELGPGQRRQARDAGVGRRACVAPAQRAPRGRLGGGARSRHAHGLHAPRRGHRHASSDLRVGSRGGHVAPPTRRTAARAVPRIEHRQLRSAGRRCVPADHPRSARARRRAAPRDRSRQAGARAAAGLRRSARRDRGVQPQPAGARQPRARRELRPRRVHAPRGVERRGVARGDAPRVHAPSARRCAGRVGCRGIAGGRDDLDRELVQVRAGSGGCDAVSRVFRQPRAMGRRRGRFRADARRGWNKIRILWLSRRMPSASPVIPLPICTIRNGSHPCTNGSAKRSRRPIPALWVRWDAYRAIAGCTAAAGGAVESAHRHGAARQPFRRRGSSTWTRRRRRSPRRPARRTISSASRSTSSAAARCRC